MRFLDSCWFKLCRAEEHMNVLEGELQAFLTPDSYRIERAFRRDDKSESGMISGSLVRRVFFSELPLPRWGTLVGDILVNLRAALDHAVYAIAYSGNPDSFINYRRTEFLICDSERAFRQKKRSALRGLPRAAVAVVQQSQPYVGTDDVTNHPLWVLRELSNLDKHRFIPLTTWIAHKLELEITSVSPGVVIHSKEIMHHIRSGDEFVRIHLSYPPTETDPFVDMDRSYWFTIALDENIPWGGKQVQSAMYELIGSVESTLNLLTPYIHNPPDPSLSASAS